jgi:hypothetical protein
VTFIFKKSYLFYVSEETRWRRAGLNNTADVKLNSNFAPGKIGMTVWCAGTGVSEKSAASISKIRAGPLLPCRQKRQTALTQWHLFVAANQNTMTVT